MMRPAFFFALIGALLCTTDVVAQRYMTRDGTIRFYSETPVEDIEAVNNQVSTAIDLDKGEIVFSLLMKAFTFEKALMQEHFNEKYVESDKFPKATFKGKIEDAADLELNDAPQEVSIKGALTIHGVTRDITITATLALTNQKNIVGKAVFDIAPADYDIKIPAAVRDNIAKQIQVTVNARYAQV